MQDTFVKETRNVKMKKKLLALSLAMVMALGLAACGTPSEPAEDENTDADAPETTATEIQGVEDGVLTVGMECSYAPYNWTQQDDSNDAVPIENVPNSYANGYDVMIAKKICEANGWELKIQAIEWNGLTPALQSGTIDAVIAGQSMTDERLAEVDMAGPYYYASIVCLTKADSEVATAKGISELKGTCTAQTGTIWYTTCLPQAAEKADIQIQAESESAPAMIMAAESGTVDFVCTDMPTAMGAVAAYPDLTILDFSENAEDDFNVSEGDINIGISVLKGNTGLKDAIDKVLSTMTAEDFNALMEDAIAVQPAI